MKTIKQLLTPLALLALTTTLSFATVYSDGEDGTTTGWRVYDNSPTGATIENIVDTDKNSKIIEFKGDGRKNAYMIGDKKNSKGWKNSTELTMKWSMNFSEKFKISVYLKTKKGNRVLYYDAKNSDRGFYKKKYIRLGLGSASNSGKWVDISRNLEADLQKHEPSNYIKMVSGMKIQGSGKIDNLELIKSNGQPVGDLQISDIKVIKLKDDYAKVAWKLNHKATGQVEYGTTTDYGNFSNKEDSFKLTYHRQSLRGLEAGTTYHYRVISEDEAGNRVVSKDKSFTTTNGDTTSSDSFLKELLTGEIDSKPKVTVAYNREKKRAYIFVEPESSYAKEYQGLTVVNMSNKEHPTIINHLPLKSAEYDPEGTTHLFFTANKSILVLSIRKFSNPSDIEIYSIDISNDLLNILDSTIHSGGLWTRSFHKVDNLDIFYTKDDSAERVGHTFYYITEGTGVISKLSMGILGFSDYNYLIEHGAIGSTKYYKVYRQYKYGSQPYTSISRKEIYDISNLPETPLLETIFFDESIGK